ncbi:F0F1 ATP synthase subunit delta [Campylobacter cuniculorum]|uniref:F0F1 ATP synthase subunit delta n=1 Tax=Campylobacter cuniculorum TaxID=374106 RepID=UPI0023F155E7|nr:F0F1 ATP synthase subunit delta [Campylobacter cuniculorum]
MNDLIAKKYAKAVAPRADMNEFYNNLCVLNSAFTLPKFKTLIESTQIKKDKKLELIHSFFTQMSPNFKNFLKLLAENSRLSYIPQIVKELEKEISYKGKTYLGVVYTQENLDEEKLKELENKLSTRLNAKIKLKNQLNQDKGVKITLEELGYEISFSMKDLQNKISEFILKNI